MSVFSPCSPVHSILSPDSQVPPRSVYANFLLWVCWLQPFCLLIPTKALAMRLDWGAYHCYWSCILHSRSWRADAPDIPGFTVGILQPWLPGTLKPKSGSLEADTNDPCEVVRCDMRHRTPGRQWRGCVLTSCSTLNLNIATHSFVSNPVSPSSNQQHEGEYYATETLLLGITIGFFQKLKAFYNILWYFLHFLFLFLKICFSWKGKCKDIQIQIIAIEIFI